MALLQIPERWRTAPAWDSMTDEQVREHQAVAEAFFLPKGVVDPWARFADRDEAIRCYQLQVHPWRLERLGGLL